MAALSRNPSGVRGDEFAGLDLNSSMFNSLLQCCTNTLKVFTKDECDIYVSLYACTTSQLMFDVVTGYSFMVIE